MSFKCVYTSYVCPSRSLASHQFPHVSRTRRFLARYRQQWSSISKGFTVGVLELWVVDLIWFLPYSAVSERAGTPPARLCPLFAWSGPAPWADCTPLALRERMKNSPWKKEVRFVSDLVASLWHYHSWSWWRQRAPGRCVFSRCSSRHRSSWGQGGPMFYSGTWACTSSWCEERKR